MKLLGHQRPSVNTDDIRDELSGDHDVEWFDNVERLNDAVWLHDAVVFIDDETPSASQIIRDGVQLIQERNAPRDIIVIGARRDADQYGEGLYFIPWSADDIYESVETVLKRVSIKDGSEQHPGDLADENATFYGDVSEQFDERANKVFDIEDQLDHLNEVLSEHNCSRVLDVGCGTGRISNPLARLGYDVTGFDIQESYLESAQHQAPETENIAYEQGDMLRLTHRFDEASFDAVLLIWNTICEAKRNWPDVLKNTHYVLRSGGVLVLDLPDTEDLDDEVKQRGISGVQYVEEVSEDTTYRGHIPDSDLFFDMLEELNYDVSVDGIEYGRNSLLIKAVKEKQTSIFKF